MSSLRSPGKACCEAGLIRLTASAVGLSGGCKDGLTLKELYLLAAAYGRETYSW